MSRVQVIGQVFRTTRSHDLIDVFNCTERTTGTITYFPHEKKGSLERSRVGRRSSKADFWDTWAEAHAHLVARTTDRITALEEEHFEQVERMKKIKQMKDPTK